MAVLGYSEGQHDLPRVRRFLARNARKPSFRRIASLLRKKRQRGERRAAARFRAVQAAAAAAVPGPGALRRRRHEKRGAP